MFGLGMGELLVILIVVLIFGSNKLPEIGSGLGRAIRDFRKELKKPDEIDVTPEKKSDTSPDLSLIHISEPTRPY